MTFEEFFRLYYSVMVKRCQWKIADSNAEDIVVEAFLLLYRKWDSIEPHEPKVLLVWFYRSLDYKIMEYRKKSKNAIPFIEDILTEENEELFVDDKEDGNSVFPIDEIRSQLTPAEKEVLACLFDEELSYRETAERLRISESAVRVRWLRTREHIKILLK